MRVPGKTLKHVFTLVVAGTYLIALLDLRSGTLELLADVLATYFIARAMKSRKSMPWIVFWCVPVPTLIIIGVNYQLG